MKRGLLLAVTPIEILDSNSGKNIAPFTRVDGDLCGTVASGSLSVINDCGKGRVVNLGDG